MSDLINRQDAIDTVEELNRKVNDGREFDTICTSDVLRRINALPSADAGDGVGRYEKAMQKMREIPMHLNGVKAKQITIMAGVVRCKDCKWHLNGHLCKKLSQYGSIETPPGFYCEFGERRE